MAKKEVGRDLFFEVTKLSEWLENRDTSYVGNSHQNYIVAKIIASKGYTTVSVILTGTGKIFICAILQLDYKK